MVKCPKCKSEIEDLRYFAKVETWGYFRLCKDGENPELDEEERGYGDSLEIYCPECDYCFKNEEEAIKFLMGGKNDEK